MRYGGDRGRPQGFGQAPQGLPIQGGQSGYPGAGPGMPMGGGMPPGGGMYPGGNMSPNGGMQPGMGMPPNSMGMVNPGSAPSPGGSIRNNLGSGLKSQGVFQKDGKINNSRGGFIGPKHEGGGTMGSGPFSFLGQGGGGVAMNQPRQLILEAAQVGIAANGVATISPDHVFTCIANLPLPNTLIGQGNGTYAAYLVDQDGSAGFLAGILRPVGNGVYQTQFRSQVPLSHYSRVLITVENPQRLGHVPSGPIILQVRQPTGPSRFLSPVKKVGGSVWQKISGFVQGRGKAPIPPLAPGEGAAAPEIFQSVNPTNPVNVEIPGTPQIPPSPPVN